MDLALDFLARAPLPERLLIVLGVALLVSGLWEWAADAWRRWRERERMKLLERLVRGELEDR